MNTIGKLLIATALVASAAAPAFAVDYNSELQAGSSSTTVVQPRTSDWTNAYAQDNGMTRNNGMWVRPAAGQQRGFDQINGGM